MILSGDKAGHPWHGLWKASVGKIVAPGDVEIDTPGDAPSSELRTPYGVSHPALQLPPGDVFTIRIPGQPAVSTTEHEEGIGRSWLNFGVMSGIRHRLYGVELGPGAWIYIDEEKTPWLCLASVDYENALMSVSFKQFGHFQPATASVVQTEDNALGGLMIGEQWVIDDLSVTGNDALITFFDDSMYGLSGFYADMGGVRRCRSGIRLQVSGIPPLATVSLTAIVEAGDAGGVDAGEVDNITWRGDVLWINNTTGLIDLKESKTVNTVLGDPSPSGGDFGFTGGYGSPPAGTTALINIYPESRYNKLELSGRMIGLCFDAEGDPHVAAASWKLESTYSGTVGYVDDSTDENGSAEVSGFYRINIAAQQLSAPLSADMTFSGVNVWNYIPHDLDASFTGEFGGISLDHEETWSDFWNHYWFKYGVTAGFDVHIAKTLTSNDRVWATTVRYANGLFAILLVTGEDANYTASSFRHFGYITADDVATSAVDVSVPAGHFKTRKWTGDVASDSQPVCFV